MKYASPARSVHLIFVSSRLLATKKEKVRIYTKKKRKRKKINLVEVREVWSGLHDKTFNREK